MLHFLNVVGLGFLVDFIEFREKHQTRGQPLVYLPKCSCSAFGKIMLPRSFNSTDQTASQSWQDLGEGAPTIMGFANLCSQALTSGSVCDLQDLSDEAKAILAAVANRGTMDIRASREPFDSAQRLLAVCAEFELDRRLLFLRKDNPEQTVRFLEGFRQLCQSGLVLHHLHKDFSLSAAGFEIAKQLNRADYEALLDFAVEIEH